MTKKLLTLAAFVRDEWMRQVSLDLQAEPPLRVQEKTVLLNRTEAAFVDAETRHLLEGQRRRRPPPQALPNGSRLPRRSRKELEHLGNGETGKKKDDTQKEKKEAE